MSLMIEKLLGFVMVLTRISAFFLVLPIFSWQNIPVNVKVAFTLLLAIFFSMIIPVGIDPKEVSLPEAILLIASEAICGLALGLVVNALFSAVKLSGQVVKREMGLAWAEILDPLSAESSGSVGLLLEMIFIILFLNANGHHLFLLVISKSYEAFPAGSIPSIPVLTGTVVKAGSVMLLTGLKLAAPILAALLLLMVVLSFLARMVPEMNILFISLPMRVGLGLLMMLVFLPFINDFVGEFANLMGKLLPY